MGTTDGKDGAGTIAGAIGGFTPDKVLATRQSNTSMGKSVAPCHRRSAVGRTGLLPRDPPSRASAPHIPE